MTDFFCISCGHALKSAARFCPECGASREIEVPTSPVPIQSPANEISITEERHPNDVSTLLINRLKALPKSVLIATSLAVVVILVLGLQVANSSDDTAVSVTVPTSVPDLAPVDTTIPTSVNRYLELGVIEPTCATDELWWEDSTGRFVINGTSSGALVADSWKYRGRENIVVQCGVDAPVSLAIVLKLEVDRLRLISSASASGTLVERASDTVVRVGVARACCYPKIPLSNATVFRFQFRGQIKSDTRSIVRFHEWDVDAWRCRSLNEPEWDEGVNLDDTEISEAESGFVTVCSEGSDVFDLQDVLINKGYEIESDGMFGPGTLNALLDYSENADKYGVEGVVAYDGDFVYAKHQS